jgi:hypothetical protein
LTIEISFENEDGFVRNLACFRAELRFALGTPLPSGFLKGSLTLASAAHPPSAAKK